MPRRARLKGESGIYHIIMRGINRQSIFEDEEDNQKFILTLQRYKAVSGFELYAYCLMGNHVHLLLKAGWEPLEQIMRRICGSFVYWYNKKYERIGNLFQDRFKSEAVETDAYFLTCLRYIHQNPLKAGLVKDLESWMWSSYGAYFDEDKDVTKFVDEDFALKIFSEDRHKARQYFRDYHQKEKNDTCLDIEDAPRLTDREASKIIQKLCDVKSGQDLNKMDKEKRNLLLRKLKDEYRLSIRQLERITGINRGMIFKA